MEAGMTTNVIYLYPEECSYQKQKEVYLRFYVAHMNSTGARKRAMHSALMYFIQHWNITLKDRAVWVVPVKRDHMRL